MKKIALVLSAILYNATASSTVEDDFLSTLETVNKEVHEKKLNIDHTPSTISVLRYDDLVEVGIKNLQEALSLIPGVETTINNIGWGEVVIRGVRNSNSYGFDKVKILIDGVSVTTALYGSVYYYLDFPVDLIERIEVLRGPASALYGTGAYSGAINVVTKLASAKNDKELFLYGDSYSEKGAGTILSYDEDKLKIAIDGYYQDGDKTIDIKKGIRKLDEDGKSYEKINDYSVGVKLDYDNFSWMTRAKKSIKGNFYGPEEYSIDKDDLDQTNNFIFSEISYKQNIFDKAAVELKAGYNEYEFDILARAFPEAYYEYNFVKTIKNYLVDAYGLDSATAQSTAESMAEPFIQDSITDDSIYGFYSKEKTTYSTILAELPISNHNFLAEFTFSETKNIKNSYSANYFPQEDIESDVLGGSATFDWTEVNSYKNGFIGDDTDRSFSAFAISDVINYDSFDISLAFRSDDYNHFKPVTSTNIGAVYRASDASHIKIAYGQAFRIPSWLEYYTQDGYTEVSGNKDIKPEKIETTELFWTYIPNSNNKFRVGAFYSKMSDVIDLAPDQADLHPDYQDSTALEDTYLNYSKRETKGIEAEYETKFDIKNKLYLSASLLDTMAYGLQPYYNTQTLSDGKDVPIPDVSNILANGVHNYSFSNNLSLSSRVYYIGEKTMNAKREKIDDFVDVTETLNYQLDKDWKVSLSIKNLLDDTHYMPSSWAFHEDGLIREERYYSLRVAGSF